MPMFSCKNISGGIGRNDRNVKAVYIVKGRDLASANPLWVGHPSGSPGPSSHRPVGPPRAPAFLTPLPPCELHFSQLLRDVQHSYHSSLA